MTASIIILSLTILVIVAGAYILYLKYFKKYTRERFAFMGVTAIAGLISTLIVQIYSNQGYISAVVNVSNSILKTELVSPKTDMRDHIITSIVILFFMSLIYKLHKNWDGQKSERQHEKERFNENPTMLNDALLQLRDFFSREKSIVPYIEQDKTKSLNIFTEHEDDKMPWHENVYELFTFSDRQYKIDLKKDYYSNEKVFISKYGLTNEYIAILCSIQYPNDSAINGFIKFAKAQKIEISKLIIAVKHHDGGVGIITKHGISIIVRTEDEMLSSLVDFSSYTDFIRGLFKTREISLGSKITLDDIYVPLNGSRENGELIGEIEPYIEEWLENSNDNRHLAILGEYGCGKSVLSLKITYNLLQKEGDKSRIPILIELRGKSPRNLNEIEILSNWASNYRIDPSSLLKLHKAGRLLIIFEGFDEMDMVGDLEMRLNHFKRLWGFAIPKSKIIITGRPNFFLDDKELKMNLGIEKQFETSHYCEAIYLEKFNERQIDLALRNIDNNTREQIREILNESPNKNFYDLISRPAILYLVAVIWNVRKLSLIKDKINSAIVISEFIKYSYSRQSTKGIHFPLTEKEREYFMIGIAVGMLWRSGFSNQINKNELESIILKLYKDFPAEITASDSVIHSKTISLHERMKNSNKAEDTVLTDVRSCGIIVNDFTRIDYFKFAHKSFHEYQVSLFYVESLLQDRGYYNIVMNTITKALGYQISSFKHSPETMTFTSEILISKLNLTLSDDNYKVCKKLFSVLYPIKFIKNHPKIAVFIDLITPSRKSQIFFFLITLYTLISKYFNESSTAVLVYYIAISLAFIFLVALTKIKIDSEPKTTRSISIWLQCCKQLNISDEVIEKIISKPLYRLLEGDRTSLFEGAIYRLLKIIKL